MATKKKEEKPVEVPAALQAVTIKLPTVAQLVSAAQKAGHLTLNPDADKFVAALLLWEKKIIELKKLAKENVEMAAHNLAPDFERIESDLVSTVYAAYGDKYYCNEEFAPEDVPAGMVEEKVSYKINTKEVDKYLEETGELPPGISANSRMPSISFRLKPSTVKRLQEAAGEEKK